MKQGSKRNPLTLRGWLIEHLADAAFRRPLLHTKKGLRRYQERLRQEQAVIVALNKAISRLKAPVKYAKFLDKMGEKEDEVCDMLKEAFGVKVVSPDKMINQPIAP